MDVAPGLLLGSRYRITDRTGEGGMGVVYRAVDEQLHRTVAVKFLSARLDADDDRLSRFRNEARALSALNHPHIVSVYDVGETGGAPYIVMELVEGETLRDRLRRSGPLPAREALDVVLQAARALAAAHEQRLIHRDIKPENVMIRRDGYVKLLDFGLVALAERDALSEPALTAASLETVMAGIAGTPAYMSPEQLDALPLDARTDVFSLGVVLCEALTGRNPFARGTMLETITAIQQTPAPAAAIAASMPAAVRAIIVKALQRDPRERYRSSADLAAELQRATADLDEAGTGGRSRAHGRRAWLMTGAAIALAVAAVIAGMAYRRSERRRWVYEHAIPDIERLVSDQRAVAAFGVLREAERFAPGDVSLVRAADKATRLVAIQSTPPGATVDVADYAHPDEGWLRVGTTPMARVRIPTGYLRWKIAAGGVESITAPPIASSMTFDLAAAARAPAGMVLVPAGWWGDMLAFLGWLGPYALPPYFIDRFEVTNRQYQEFVDKGGYATQAYWRQPFVEGARTLTWSDAMTRLRDTTGRAGPASWSGGHFPDGKGDYPVTGVSWYEAAAYAEFAGKSLPVIAQGFNAEPTVVDQYVIPFSDLSGGLSPVGSHQGLGPYGTYDMIGNAREWYWNGNGSGLRYTLGRQPASYGPEALPPFDRSSLDGFRCVRNGGAMPTAALADTPQLSRDFSHVVPVSDETFRVYRQMYAYDKLPLHAVVDTGRESTEDWTREKITVDTAYGNQRMSMYLFLPKRARPPFQAVVFFPSARVNFIEGPGPLGDLGFVDYVVQSGRAVLYPIYDGLYERRADAPTRPGPTVQREQIVHWSKDLGRGIDYLQSRPDIDGTRIGYLGVSQGSAYGVILTALEDRFKAVVFLDGGFLQFPNPIAGLDQADFAPRVTKPVLMVNGRYDATFPAEAAQDPLFRLLGTPADDKRHVTFETPHDVRLKRADLVREVLAWYDRYLGRVE